MPVFACDVHESSWSVSLERWTGGSSIVRKTYVPRELLARSMDRLFL